MQSKDLFDDSTMSFGEHLEILRIHLWKALIGMVICVIVALFIGDTIVAIVRSPIDQALRDFGQETTDDLGGFNFIEYLKSVISGEAFAGPPAGITDAGLKELQQLTNLQRLNVDGSQVSAAGLRNFSKALPEVEPVVDALSVAGLNSLRELGAKCELNDSFDAVAVHLDGQDITHEALSGIAKQSSLRSLVLSDAAVEDVDLQIIASLKKLTKLHLSFNEITDDGLVYVKKLKQLEELDLQGNAITDDGAQQLAALTNLRILVLTGTQVSNAGLKSLKKLTNLEQLALSGTKISDSGLEHIAALTKLERLQLINTRISDAGMKHLQELKQLRELNLSVDTTSAAEVVETKLDAVADDTIIVKLKTADLKDKLRVLEDNNANQKNKEDATILLQLTAPEFAQFRETSEQIDKPITLNVQEAFLTYLKVAIVAGLVMGSPWIFYQIWLFVAAGLYPHEQKYVYIFLPVSLTLFIGGAMFCFFLVFPFVLKFLLGFNEMLEIHPQIRLSEWISFAIMLPVMFGISFQLPLVMLFLERISIFEATGYREKRRMAVLVIAILSMLLTPADPMSMVLMMIPLMVLYELGIVMCRFSAAKSPFAAETP